MRPAIGFSTGAIAKWDFRTGVSTLRALGVVVVEVSALRMSELGPLAEGFGKLDLGGFEHVSVHAPSRFAATDEAGVVRVLEGFGVPVVVHPDVIFDARAWRGLGARLFVENMDVRKAVGQTASSLSAIFTELPEARLCFDVAHAWQVDATGGEARRILEMHGARLAQVHLSVVDERSAHVGLTESAVREYRAVAPLMAGVPVVLESVVTDVAREIALARGVWA